jgi:hypothetical protein
VRSLSDILTSEGIHVKPKRKARVEKPYCFVSYSSHEAHVNLLIECLQIVLKPHFDVTRTPSALESGASQRDQIIKLIESCAFAVVALDGLRPNVVFEYGIIQGNRKPVMLFKEAEATVDIEGLFGEADLPFGPVELDLDSQFSDVKDQNYAVWSKHGFRATVRLVWEQYGKKRSEIPGYVSIPEPILW